MRQRHRTAATAALFILGCAMLASCGGSGEKPGGVSGPVGRAASNLKTKSQALKRAFEDRAARARDDLEEARRVAEELLGGQHTREAARQARERAEEALERGATILRQAARDGDQVAEDWARLIQERMMRLERSLDALARAGAEHAES